MCKSNENTFLVDIADIQKVRITCNKCGTAVIMPLSAINVSSTCVNCCHELPELPVKSLMSELRALKTALADKNVTFQLHLEGE